jgi:hypothetical protein
MSERRYTMAEVQAILRRAQQAEQPGEPEGMSRDELAETAREVGIAPAELERALAAFDHDAAIGAHAVELQRKSRRGFYSHLLTFVWVNALLFVINLQTGGPWWCVWPLLGWGAGLVMHGQRALFPDPEVLLERAERAAERRKLRESQRRFKRAVSQGLSHLLEGTASKIDDAIAPDEGQDRGEGPSKRKR